jgi:hypothetical protein
MFKPEMRVVLNHSSTEGHKPPLLSTKFLHENGVYGDPVRVVFCEEYWADVVLPSGLHIQIFAHDVHSVCNDPMHDF